LERWRVGHRIREVEVGPDGALWMLEDNDPGGLFRETPKSCERLDLWFFIRRSFGWNVVLLGARFVARLHPEVMTGTALEPPLGTA